MKVVITGGNGFVGQHLRQLLLEKDHLVEVWDREKAAGFEPSLVIDITQPESYAARLEEVQPDWIVHLAAVASVSFALEHPEETNHINVEGTRLLLETARRYSPATKFLVISSADIYPTSEVPIAELPLSEAAPRNPYAMSKLLMEQMIEKEFNDRCIRVRPFPHIGAGQREGFVVTDFVSQIVAGERSAQQPLVLKVGNLEAKRDFTDVRDVVRAYQLLLEKGSVGEVYNVATGKVTSIQELLDMLVTLSGAKIVVERDPARMRPSDNPIVVGDATKLRTATGWQPTVSLLDSLQDILSYWRNERTS